MEILPLVKSTSVIQDGFNALIKSVRNQPKILERTKHLKNQKKSRENIWADQTFLS